MVGEGDDRCLWLISSIIFMHEKSEEGQAGGLDWGQSTDLPRALTAVQLSLRVGLRTQLPS